MRRAHFQLLGSSFSLIVMKSNFDKEDEERREWEGEREMEEKWVWSWSGGKGVGVLRALAS